MKEKIELEHGFIVKIILYTIAIATILTWFDLSLVKIVQQFIS